MPFKAPAARAAVAALWTLPLWVARFPPMVDYPQQLALAAILRWYGDPARRFRRDLRAGALDPARPVQAAHGGARLGAADRRGRPAGGLAVAGGGGGRGPGPLPAGGRPGGYALLALALTYNYAFFWGFVDNLLAYPLALGGMALADSLFDRPFGARSWLALAGVGVLFYTVHLQFLLIFAGAVGWLALCRLPPWRTLALWLSALVPGLAAGLAAMAYGVLRSPVGVITDYERRMRQAAPVRLPLGQKLAYVPDLLFGPTADQSALVALGLLLALALVAVAFRTRHTGAGTGLLFRTRFATLAGWLALLYLGLPEFRGGYLIAQRIAPLAAMVAVTALPMPRPERRRLVAFLGAALLVFQLGQTLSGFLRFRAESAGFGELLAGAKPGRNLAGLIYDRGSASWPRMPVYLHFPAYYQAFEGGRILFSFAELFQTSARFRPGRSWDPLLAEWNEWTPQLFDWERHGGRFDYFLVRRRGGGRGGELPGRPRAGWA